LNEAFEGWNNAPWNAMCLRAFYVSQLLCKILDVCICTLQETHITIDVFDRGAPVNLFIDVNCSPCNVVGSLTDCARELPRSGRDVVYVEEIFATILKSSGSGEDLHYVVASQPLLRHLF